MVFSDGTLKEGYFENNVYRGKAPIVDDVILEETNEELMATIR